MARAMKPSGVEWLGDIPADWDCCKLKYLISSLNSGTSITATDLTEDGYPVYGGGQQIGFFSQFNIEDTLIIGRVGSCGHVTKILGKAWATDNALIVTTDFPINYLYYILVAAELNELSTSNAQPLITSRKVLNHKVAVCWDKDEQERIAAYLDDKCGRIDSVIAKTRATVAEYKKLKQAIITRAVTKGIRPNRPTKDSGVEWLGDIPADWKVCKLKHSIEWKSEKGQPNAVVLSLYRDYGVIPKNSRDDNHNVTSLDTSTYKVVSKGDFVINKMKAWQGSMAVSDYDGIVSPAYHVCKIIDSQIVLKYLHYLLRNQLYLPEYKRLSTGMRIGQWDLSFEDFKNLPFILPSQDEQQEIAAYLDEKTAAIDSLVAKKNRLVSELESLKKSLIFEYVTGKKEVPT